jgi:hypothetical protein
MSDPAVARMSVVIDYEDGSHREYTWIAEVKPVEVTINRGMGERKAESGSFTIEVSRWPGGGHFRPAAERGDSATQETEG